MVKFQLVEDEKAPEETFTIEGMKEEDFKIIKEEKKVQSAKKTHKKEEPVIEELAGNSNKFVKLRLIHLTLFGKELRLDTNGYVNNIIKKLEAWREK